MENTKSYENETFIIKILHLLYTLALSMYKI